MYKNERKKTIDEKKKAIDFTLDGRTIDLLEELKERTGMAKSKIVREAIKFYADFRFDEESKELLNKLSQKTRLPPRSVLMVGLKILDETMKIGGKK